MTIKKLLTSTVCCFVLFASIVFADDPYGKIKLLDGYKYKRIRAVDTINGVIFKDKDDGLRIEFESGISEGYAADPKEKKNYIWFREQEINGHKVFLALTEAEGRTKWKPEKPRQSKPRHILMVTFPGNFGSMDAANFYAEVLDEKELADMLLMVLTFDPAK